MKYKKLILLLSFVLFYSGLMSQKNYPHGNIGLTSVARENQGNSYITFPSDFGKMDPLWFEADIVPNFVLRTAKDARVVGILTPEVMLRMYREESFPVKTPSYKPQLTMYYAMRRDSFSRTSNLFFRIAHHSNGQYGDFYLPDGSINTENGNFATNYFELGFIKTSYIPKYDAIKFISASLEIHPPLLSNTELKGEYGLYRLNASFSIFKLPQCRLYKRKKKSSISTQVKMSWIFGEMGQTEPYSFKRLMLSLRFAWHPRFLEDVGLFVQYYEGFDYYNIYFKEYRYVLRFGIITEKLRF